MMKKEKFLKLLSRSLSKDISVADREVLEKAIQSNEEYKLLAIELGLYFNNQKADETKTDQLNLIWEKIKAEEGKTFEERFNYSTKKVKIAYTDFIKAAIILLFLGAGILGYHMLNRKANLEFSAAVATNEKIFKVLDDGTKIWLNKNSSLSYNKSFGKHNREIFLEGEAYFDVVKNTAVPLFIHAGNIDIEVKGTAFNVNARKEDPEIKVALIRGAIEVTDRLDGKHKVLLKPNEKLIFSTSKVPKQNFLVIAMKPSLLLTETKWTSDTIIFRKEKLKDLAVRMEKKYDLKITIESEQLKEKRFSGTFINETIQEALAALKLSYPLTYTINNRLVVIKE